MIKYEFPIPVREIEGSESYFISACGRAFSTKQKKVKELKLHLTTNGYPHIIISKGSERKSVLVHKIVLTTYGGPRPEGMQVGHLNGIKTDNRIENLKWVTIRENSIHTFAHGTMHCAKLTHDQVIEVKRLLRDGVSGAEVGRRFGLKKHSVSEIKTGKHWSFINI